MADPNAIKVQGPDSTAAANPLPLAGTDTITGEPKGGSIVERLDRLIWSVDALRRVYCEATENFYEEYPGTGDPG